MTFNMSKKCIFGYNVSLNLVFRFLNVGVPTVSRRTQTEAWFCQFYSKNSFEKISTFKENEEITS